MITEQDRIELDHYWSKPLRASNIYYRLWWMRRKIRPLLYWRIG